MSHEWLLDPWKRLAKVLMRYITLEGRFRVAYAYHFNLLNHFKFPLADQLNFPFFICHSIEYSIVRFRRNIISLPLHESIMYLIYINTLERWIPRFYVKTEGIVFKKEPTSSQSLSLSDANCGKSPLEAISSDADVDNITLAKYFKTKGSIKQGR